jgi:competence protein ComEC
METLRTANVPVFRPGKLREQRKIGGVEIALLHPRGGLEERDLKINDRSLVLKLSYQGKSFLFTGDLEKTGDDILVLRAGSILKSQVLLVPHHGSITSCSSSFLNCVRPGACVISLGDGNAFGFPSLEVLKRLESLGCAIFRTDKDGAVEVTVGPEGGMVRTFVKRKEKGTGGSGPHCF